MDNYFTIDNVHRNQFQPPYNEVVVMSMIIVIDVVAIVIVVFSEVLQLLQHSVK